MDNDILILTNDVTKLCARCGRELPVSHYHRNTKSKDGYQSWCIECKRDYNHQRSIYRITRRIGINHKSIISILGSLQTISRGELTDTKIVFAQALDLINQHIKTRKQ